MGYNVKHGGYSNTVHLKITKKQSLKVINQKKKCLLMCGDEC